MALFRLLHISDLHIAGRGGTIRQSRYDIRLLQEIARFAYNYRESIDAVLISGDLADIGGIPDDLEAALNFIAAHPNNSADPWLTKPSGFPTLKACGKPILVLPGNHDRYQGISRFPGCKHFDRTFSDFWNADSGVAKEPISIEKEGQALAIVCADFSLAKIRDGLPVGYFGQGKAYAHRLKRLRKITHEIKEKKPHTAVVWSLHFAPEADHLFTPLTYSFHELKDGKRLMRTAQKSKVNFLCCGHTHRKDFYESKTVKGVWVHCSGTSSCLKQKEDTSVHLLNLNVDNGRLISVYPLSYIWEERARTFVPEKISPPQPSSSFWHNQMNKISRFFDSFSNN